MSVLCCAELHCSTIPANVLNGCGVRFGTSLLAASGPTRTHVRCEFGAQPGVDLKFACWQLLWVECHDVCCAILSFLAVDLSAYFARFATWRTTLWAAAFLAQCFLATCFVFPHTLREFCPWLAFLADITLQLFQLCFAQCTLSITKSADLAPSAATIWLYMK